MYEGLVQKKDFRASRADSVVASGRVWPRLEIVSITDPKYLSVDFMTYGSHGHRCNKSKSGIFPYNEVNASDINGGIPEQTTRNRVGAV